MATANAQNLIQNGDFEALTGWRFGGKAATTINGAANDYFTVSVGPLNSGANLARGWSLQTINTVPGETYTVKFTSWLDGIDSGQIAVSGAAIDSSGEQIAFLGSSATKTPKEYEFTFVATEATTTLRFEGVGAVMTGGTSRTAIDDVIVYAGDGEAPGGNEIVGTAGDDYLRDTDANGTLLGGDGRDTFVLGGKGDDIVDGQGGGYNQVDLLGKAEDYTFTRNTDGTYTVSSAAHGTDTLKNIDAIYFYGSEKWSLIGDLAPIGGSKFIYGTAGNDYLKEPDSHTRIFAGDGDDYIDLNNKTSSYVDGGSGYNQVNLAGSASDYTITRASNGDFLIKSANSTVDSLHNVQGIFFYGENKWYSPNELAVGLNGAVYNGTDGDDWLTGTAGNDHILAGAGNDTIFATKGNDVYDGGSGYNQVNYEGAASDYTISKNADGSWTVASVTNDTDKLVDIQGLWFNGEAQWYDINHFASPLVANKLADIDLPHHIDALA